MNVESLYLTAPLDFSQFDFNFKTLIDFLAALKGLIDSRLGDDGLLKAGSISSETAFVDRVITAAKLHWFANFFCVASGVDDYAGTISPASPWTSFGSAVTETTLLICLFTASNTGPATLNLNAGTAYPIKKIDGSDLVGGDISAGQMYAMVFNGTGWQIISSTEMTATPNPSLFTAKLSAKFILENFNQFYQLPLDKCEDGENPSGVFDTANYWFLVPSNGYYEIYLTGTVFYVHDIDIMVDSGGGPATVQTLHISGIANSLGDTQNFRVTASFNLAQNDKLTVWVRSIIPTPNYWPDPGKQYVSSARLSAKKLI